MFENSSVNHIVYSSILKAMQFLFSDVCWIDNCKIIKRDDIIVWSLNILGINYLYVFI